MKTKTIFFFIFFAILLVQESISQNYNVLSDNLDSLKAETLLPHSDDEKATLFLSISSTYLHINSDSCIHYAEKCIEVNKKSPNKQLSFMAIGTIVEGLIYQGNLPKALEIGLAGLSEKTSLSLGNSGKGRINNGVGEIYTYLEDYPKARYYFTELTNMKGFDIMGVAFGHYRLAQMYEVQNVLDSALYHLDKSFETFSVINKSATPYIYETYPGWYNVRAKVYLKQNKTQLAKADLFKTLAITKNSNEGFHTSNTFYDLAELYKNQNQIDSSIYFAEKALAAAEEINYTRGIFNASDVLSILLDEKDPKKALHYFKIHAEAKNKLYSSGNIQAMKEIVAQNEKRATELQNAKDAYQIKLRFYLLLFGLTALAILAFLLYRNNKRKEKANKVLQSQKEEIDFQKQTAETALKDLKSTQAQLIQSEKMASLGELTAGIAHEIQNPLNFVNNFSEVSEELVKEIKDERLKTKDERDEALEDEILTDIEQNLQKIHHHGDRASSIVKGMLEHSRTSTGTKELTDINALADEYLRLSYHGLRAKDKDFNAEMVTDFDPNLPKIEVIPQDIGRVLLNLINNAFQACIERSSDTSTEPVEVPLSTQENDNKSDSYKPTVTVSTQLTAQGQLLIAIKDNGPGIPDAIKDKIFQPFFTTKDTGKGTGLGLSLAYDIVNAHGGELKVESQPARRTGQKNISTKFIISLPY
jgi:two-component system NtrC family sensor kinase